MKGFEWNELREPDGKRFFKVSLHEVYPDREHKNGNGLCYLREYTQRNLSSINEDTIPLCCSFADEDKRVPLDHGATGVRMKDGMPMYEDSIVVGTILRAEIEEMDVDGERKQVLMGHGVLYEQRYPQLVEWIEGQLARDVSISGSVEFVGKSENDGVILYEPGASDEFRVPTDYLYSGYCLLTVPAADKAAFLLEMNQLAETKEGNSMDEQMKSEINATIITAFGGLREVEEALRKENEELKKKLEEKCAEVSEMSEKLAQHEAQAAANAAELEKFQAQAQAQVEQLTSELNEIKAGKVLTELNSALADFTDAEKAVAEEDIKAFKEDPLAHAAEVNQITNKIAAAAYKAMKAKKAEAPKLEINSLIETAKPEIPAPEADFDPASIFGQ